MDSESVKAIELNGIVHNATKIGVQDGDCEDLVNLRFKDGSWRASGDGKHVFSMQYQSDVANTNGLTYTQLYIHTNVYRHILGVRDGRLYWFGNIDADGVFEAKDTPAELTTVSGDLYICQTGHLLTIIDDAGGFEYLLFKPADTLYKKLYVDENGSQTDRGVYPFGAIHFNWADAGEAGTINDDKTNQEGWDEWGKKTDWNDGGRIIEIRGKNFGSLSGGGLETLHNMMVEMYGKLREKNYFTDPFLVCAAIKLYDGKYMYASAPTMIFPRQRAYNTKSRCVHKNPTDKLNDGFDEITSRGVYSNNGALLLPNDTISADWGMQYTRIDNIPGNILHTPTDLTDEIGTISTRPVEIDNFQHARQGGEDVSGVFRNGIYATTRYTTGSPYAYAGYYGSEKSSWKFQIRGCNLCVSIDSNLLKIMEDNKDIFQSLCIFITQPSSVYEMDVEKKGWCRRTLDTVDGSATVTNGSITTTQFFRTSVANMSYMPKQRGNDDIQYDLLHSQFYLLREYTQDELPNLLNNPIVDLQDPKYDGVLNNIAQQDTLKVEAVTRYSYIPKVQYIYNGRLHIANYIRTQFHGYPLDTFHLNNHSLQYYQGGNEFRYFKKALFKLTSFHDDTLSEKRTTHYLNRWANTQLREAVLKSKDVSAYILVEVETINNGIQNVCKYIPFTSTGNSDFIETLDTILSFPDSRAKKMTISILENTDGSTMTLYKKEFELKPHPYLNLAYYMDKELSPIELDKKGTKSVTEYQTNEKPNFNPAPEENNTTEDYSNGLKVSSTNNPLYFPVENTYQVGSSEVVAMMSNSVAVGTGQTGSAPLYIFCKDGVYAMFVDEKGEMAYTNSRVIARDVCNNAKSVTPIDSGVVFTTDRGLMSIAGEQVSEIGQPLEGDWVQFTTADHIDFSKIAKNAYYMKRLAGLPDESDTTQDSMTQTDFLSYLKGSIINYNHNEFELMVSNPNYNYTYILNKQRDWSRRDIRAEEYVNNYPTSYRVAGSEWYQVDKQSDADNGIFLMSHIIKLDSIGFKELHRVAARGYWQTCNKKVYKTIDIPESKKEISLTPAQGTLAEYNEKSVSGTFIRNISQDLYRLDIPASQFQQELITSLSEEQIVTLQCVDCTIDTSESNSLLVLYKITDDYGNIIDSEEFDIDDVTETTITLRFYPFSLATELESNKAYHIVLSIEGEVFLKSSNNRQETEFDCERELIGDRGGSLTAELLSQVNSIYNYTIKTAQTDIRFNYGTTTTILKDLIEIPDNSVGVLKIRTGESKILLSTYNQDGENASTLINSIQVGTEDTKTIEPPAVQFQLVNEKDEVVYALDLLDSGDRDNLITYADTLDGVTRTFSLYQNLHLYILGEEKTITLPTGKYRQRIVTSGITTIAPTPFYGAEFEVSYNCKQTTGNILDTTSYTNNNLIDNENLPAVEIGDNGETAYAYSLDTTVKIDMHADNYPQLITYNQNEYGNTTSFTIPKNLSANLSLTFNGNGNGLVFDLYALKKDGTTTVEWNDGVSEIDPDYGEAILCICDSNGNIVWSYAMQGDLVTLKEENERIYDWRIRYKMSDDYDAQKKRIDITLPTGTYHTEIRLQNVIATTEESSAEHYANFVLTWDMKIHATMYIGSATNEYKMLALTTPTIAQHILRTIPEHTETVVDTDTSYEGLLGLYIFGSYDGRKWALLGHREKSGDFRDIGALVERTDCRFFRFVLAGQVSKDSRFDYFEVSSRKSKLNGKIR